MTSIAGMTAVDHGMAHSGRESKKAKGRGVLGMISTAISSVRWLVVGLLGFISSCSTSDVFIFY